MSKAAREVARDPVGAWREMVDTCRAELEYVAYREQALRRVIRAMEELIEIWEEPEGGKVAATPRESEVKRDDGVTDHPGSPEQQNEVPRDH